MRGSRVRRRLGTLLLTCATIALAVVLFEESMIFFPTRYPAGFWEVERLSQRSGLTIEDRFFEAEDGVRLHGWWCRPPVPAETVVLFFHGNAGNLSDRADLMIRLARLPAQVVMVDYRGYGRSEGRPSEEGLARDAMAAWRLVVDAAGVPPRRVVLFGRSLGGAVAVRLASRTEPAGVILESTFTSLKDMAAHHFPVVPRFLIRTRMDSLSAIGGITVPKLHIHSRADEVVPYALGRRLYEAAPEPKRFLEISGASHNETWVVGGETYFEAIASFLEESRDRRET
jgi:fermentation-respiration switch protein FrsA (DUF1100 family)